jgi:hypothetical protein
MAAPILNRSQAVQVVKGYLLEKAETRAEQCLVTDKMSAIGTIYKTWPQDTPVWYVLCPDNGPTATVGPSRVIIISKKTGEVLFDGYPGE